MLTYPIEQRGERPLYEFLYLSIAADIKNGTIAADEKLPSKRRFANHLGVSPITVEAAYTQLVAEGYVRTLERKGYYANALPEVVAPTPASEGLSAQDWDFERVEVAPQDQDGLLADFRGGSVPSGQFPYNAWAKRLRGVLASETEESLLGESQTQGSLRLRKALCSYVRATRGLEVTPDQIVVGAGAQYLYNMVIQLLGRQVDVAVEDPGYRRLTSIYRANGLPVSHIGMDDEGVRVDELRASGANLVHVMPSHQYPTGLVTSIGRRYELLAWAAEDKDRIILEDDYDCEFRLAGRPIPTLASIDAQGQVIYVNTFTKSLGAGFRVGYLVLPTALAKRYRERLGFYSCTVSAIDQLALASFIESGDYERHVNRMRNHYRDVRDTLLLALRSSELGRKIEVRSQDSGLHFLLGITSASSEEELAQRALERGVALQPLGDFFSAGEHRRADDGRRWFVMSYGGLAMEQVGSVVQVLAEALDASDGCQRR